MTTKPLYFLPSLRPALAAGLLSLAAVSAHASAAVGAAPATPPANPLSAIPAPAAPAAPEEDIRDIRPPYHIPSNLPWILGAASAVALAAAGYGAWRWTRKGARKLLPYEIALEKLEATRRLIHPDTAREFSIVVSEIVRTFIEQCFPARAAHRTTDEFLHELAAQTDSPLAAHREALAAFLVHCDLAKFARWTLPTPQMESMLDSARALILSIANPVPHLPAPATERGPRHSDSHPRSERTARQRLPNLRGALTAWRREPQPPASERTWEGSSASQAGVSASRPPPRASAPPPPPRRRIGPTPGLVVIRHSDFVIPRF